MPRLLTLSRAARLVGVRRGALQSRIRSGELAAFEGMVSVDDLLRAYPQARMEDNAGLEHFEAIKQDAFARRMRERLLPSTEALVARLAELSAERAQAQAQTEHYRGIVEQLQAKLRDQGDAGLLAWLQQRLAPAAQVGQPLLAQESLLRIMSAHVEVKPSGREFFVDGNDSLLEAALRSGLSLDYGCSIGSCGKCKARVVSGQVYRTRHADYGLTAAEKTAGVVLMCCHTALTDLVIEAREALGARDMPLQTIDARIKSVSPLGDEVRLLHLQTPRSNRLRFLAGQSATLCLADGVGASLPVASCPCDDRNLQFHVRRDAGDGFAARVFGGLKGVETVRIEGPRGEFVLDEASPRPLVFIAGESGFAPIKSLIEHAMALDAAETLHLYWIAHGTGGHYLDNLCRSWSDALDNFRYEPIAAQRALPDDEALQAALRQVLRDHPRLGDSDVYVAGPAPWASAAEFQLLEHGLPRAQLYVSPLAP
ncbi:MAG: 2Fe-2S iron-sulfur cluster-binding protein [Betaproteobacteria bacterium]|nr:2Fe-2S iron-sulfur cluster-binding protein [Betaproteobacteria bacterium]